MVTIIYAHPWEGSFNHAILDTIVKNLEKKGTAYTLIDLYKDQFNPVFTTKELSLFSTGKAIDPKILLYQQILKKTDVLLFIFPIWWYDIPSILKGFLEKTFLKEFSYSTGKTGLIGHLNHIERVNVITTSDSPTWFLKNFKGNAIQKVFINGTLKGVGMKKIEWINCDRINKVSQQKREKFLANLKLLTIQT